MAKIKHSFFKNSLLFCYKNVLNTDSETVYSRNNDTFSSTSSDDEYAINNDTKRKLTTNSIVNKPTNKQSVANSYDAGKHTNHFNSNKKMQNVLIHYSGNPTTIPDLVVSSKHVMPSSSSPSLHSPKSPVPKHAKQNDENYLPDVVITNDEKNVTTADVARRKNANLKQRKHNSKLNRSKSTASTKVNAENNNYTRARILSSISNILSSSPPSEISVKATPDASSLQNKQDNAFQMFTKNTGSQKQYLQSVANNNTSKGQIRNRQSYPPDSRFTSHDSNGFHTNNNMTNHSYSAMCVCSQFQNINENMKSNINSPQRIKSSKSAQSKPIIEFEISYNNCNEMNSRNSSPARMLKNDNNLGTNSVKLRKSRAVTANLKNQCEKPKRSSSAVSSTSTKKSVRFADSVGLELENIFNLSSFDNNNIDSNKISLLLSNHNLYENDNQTVYENFPTVVRLTNENSNRKYVGRSNTISTPNSVNQNNILNLKVSSSTSNESLKSGNSFLNNFKTSNQASNSTSKQDFVKTLKLANLTVRTRINKNGKLESEV